MKRTMFIFLAAFVMFAVGCTQGFKTKNHVIVPATAPQDVTTSWVDLGTGNIPVQDMNFVQLNMAIDINLATDFRVRMVLESADGTQTAVIPGLLTFGTDAVDSEPMYVEFNTDADQVVAIPWRLYHTNMRYVRFQIQAGAAGGTAGQVDWAEVIVTRD